MPENRTRFYRFCTRVPRPSNTVWTVNRNNHRIVLFHPLSFRLQRVWIFNFVRLISFLSFFFFRMEESEFANPRQLRREERFSGGKYGRQAGSKTGGQVTWLARCYFIRGKEDRRISRWMALVEENRIPQDRGWRKIWSSLVSQISTREDWPNVQPQANLGWHLLGLL